MFALFIIIGSLTFLSAGYRFATDLRLRKQILTGRATAAELVASLHLESLDEFEELWKREPTLFTRVLGFMGREEFSFSPRRIRNYRLNNLRARVQSIPVHLSALTLLVVAMFANHESVIGWLALLAALFIELLRWALPQALERLQWSGGSETTTEADIADAEPVSVDTEYSQESLPPIVDDTSTTGAAPEDDEPDEPEPDESCETQLPISDSVPESEAEDTERSEPDCEVSVETESPQSEAASDSSAPETVEAPDVNSVDATTETQSIVNEPELTRNRVYRTCVLLSAAWRPVAAVVHASLRRAGQRDAQLLSDRDSDGPVTLDAGGVLLEVELCSAPLDRATIEFAAAQSFDWPEAAEAVADHAAYIVFTARAADDTSRAAIVRLHHRVHLALTEFAPVVAALWPDAGRLVPADDLAGLAATAAENDSPTHTCITLRTFPPEGDMDAYVCDTVGLHGFGLPDLEIVTAEEPDERVSAALYELSGRFFAEGCDVSDGARVELSDGTSWLASWGQARFAPGRAVIEMQRIEVEAPPAANEAHAATPENDGD